MSRTEFSEHSRVKLSVKIIFRLIKEDYIFKNIWVKMFVLATHFYQLGFLVSLPHEQASILLSTFRSR